MKVMFSGDFINVGFRFCKQFGLNKKVNILFCGYAFEDGLEYHNAQKEALRRAFDVNKFIDLTPDYDFSDKIDVIFVNGGYGKANLVSKLVLKNHDKKIKSLVQGGAVYIGESSGAIIAGNYNYPQVFEEFQDDNELKSRLQKFSGFKFVDEVVLTHNSKYRFPKLFSNWSEPSYRILNRTSKGINPLAENLKKIKKLKALGASYVAVKENEVLVINGQSRKIYSYDWNKLPVKQNTTTGDEEKIKNILKIK